ncbi:DUF4376 domain-containing protein [Bradyrhizobium sp. CCGUVB1N3]|uniref:DUF4376 domain-containing protein n=1 Tax=Bradyrhizobium sp. CCGUVB1N3 TaxID=2949629 RepID=UPI0020B3A973|nr:DUF4376 domain-containing protein [Bradyrhizobium sp. CCGUVB1N3]MCP3471437.1 DUF4376 domain-containing protein [Bradyrhizobium sp. CCGUVB1N3]MCP3472377.1 DUF4376 domain-containing protein [Bradyrhizobium sp. CCGUVB1N3]
MVITYNPTDWYWLADDGRIFSSSKQTKIASDEADYAAWSGMGGVPTAWPRDIQGNQTDRALQEVLQPYNIFVTLEAYAAYVRWTSETLSLVINGYVVGTDDRSKLMIIGARNAAGNDPQFTTDWVTEDGRLVPIDARQMIDLSDGVQDHIGSCFAIYSQVKAGIDSGAITTHEQINDAFVNIPLSKKLENVFKSKPKGKK